MQNEHTYRLEVHWDGDPAAGTTRYDSYERQFRIRVAGKPEIVGSADPAFRGDPRLHNPEELFVAALSSCHMLVYLALCARAGIRVVRYVDDAHGRMVSRPGGGGCFEEVTLQPRVLIAAGGDGDRIARAIELHERAHASCFIASSCRVPIRCVPRVESATESMAG